MQKRLKWLSLQLRDLFPINWEIRYRLLTAGVALSALVVATPIYLRFQLSGLARTYHATAQKWEELDDLHSLTAHITDAESRLRAFVTSGDREWLEPLAGMQTEMDRLLERLRSATADDTRRAALL